ncbi:hypothetical protein, partial [Escherichia coli]|uniref:hypothetical protein n=1 Tax=Escherichia coli TaxID=562 RepID=UPI0027380CF3
MSVKVIKDNTEYWTTAENVLLKKDVLLKDEIDTIYLNINNLLDYSTFNKKNIETLENEVKSLKKENKALSDKLDILEELV